MGKRSRALVGLGVLGLLLAGWGMAPEAARAGQTLRILATTGGAVKALTEDLIPAFEKSTGVKVEGTFLPQEGLTQKAMTEFVSGAPSFDAIMFETSWGGRYAPFLVDLQSYVTKAGAQYDEADILAAGRKMGIFEGKTVGLPYRTLGRMLYYRKDLFQQAGLPGPPKTLPQLLEYAQKLTKGEVYGLGILGKQGFGNAYEYGSFLFSSGGEWWDRQSYQVRFNDAIGVRTLGFYADLKNKYKVVPPEVTTWAWDEWISGAKNGRYAMTIMHVPYATQIEDPASSKTAGKWGYADAPGWDSLEQGSPPVGGWLWGMPVETKNKDLAWQFIAYITGKEAQLKSGLNANAPSRRSAFMSAELKAKWPWADVALRSLDRGTPMYNNPEELESEAALAVIVSEVLLGAKAPQVAADEAGAKLKQILEKGGRLKK